MTISSTDSIVLESHGYNLSRLAHEWRFPPINGYEAAVSRTFSILLRKEKTNHNYNPVLIDGDEMRRWQVIRLVGGESQPYAIDMANLLVPALARRQIQLLGISTLAPFRQHIERDAAIHAQYNQLFCDLVISCIIAPFKNTSPPLQH